MTLRKTGQLFKFDGANQKDGGTQKGGVPSEKQEVNPRGNYAIKARVEFKIPETRRFLI